jgi:N-acetylmuramoyl-L-alanine amidase CwlA
MIREIEKKFPTIEEIDCDSCGNVVSYDGEVKQNFTTVSKWVPHKTVYHHYCQECINKGRINFAENGFSIYRQEAVDK